MLHFIEGFNSKNIHEKNYSTKMIEITLMAWMHFVIRCDAISFNVTNQELANQPTNDRLEIHSGQTNRPEIEWEMKTKKEKNKTTTTELHKRKIYDIHIVSLKNNHKYFTLQEWQCGRKRTERRATKKHSKTSYYNADIFLFVLVQVH